MVRNKVDFSVTRNIIITSIMLTVGVGGAVLSAGGFSLTGVGLSACVGILLNLILPEEKNEKTEKEEEPSQDEID
jgi:uracil permease